MSDTQQILVIGWDGGTWTVFDPLVARGVMPKLAALRARGSHGVMRSTMPPVTAPAWSTLITGLGPQQHGIFGFMEGMLFGETLGAAGRDARPASSLSLRGRTLFDILGTAGRRVLSVNLPLTYPPREVNGVLISGMMTPQNAATFTYPPTLADELTDYRIDINHSSNREERGRLVSQLSK